MYKSKNFRYLAAVLVMALGLAIVVQIKSQRPKSIRIAVNEWPGYSALVYGQKSGIFAKHGIDLQLVLVTSLVDVGNLLIQKKIDAGGLVFSDLVNMNTRGGDLVGLFLMATGGSGDGLVAHPKIKNIKQLKGAKIAYELTDSFSHIFLLKILEKNGIMPDQVELVDVPFDHVPKQINENLIAAGHTWEPELSKAVASGLNVIATGQDYPGIVVDVLTMQKSFLKDPKFLKKFKKAYYESLDEMLTQPEQAREYFKLFYLESHREVFDGIKKMNFVTLKQNDEILHGADEKKYFESFEYVGNYFALKGKLKDKNQIYEMLIDRNTKIWND